MKILSILSQKGGVGKTTLATCLAVAAEQDGKKTVIFDIDPQATACFWKDIREKEEPAVLSIQAVSLCVIHHRMMWQQLSGQFFKRHSEFAQTPPVTYNY